MLLTEAHYFFKKVKPKAGVAFLMNEFYRLWLVIDNTSI
jgi:hypothetical protein